MKYRYRDDLLEIFGEELLLKMEEIFERHNICYVKHATNGKFVITGPFNAFIAGYEFATVLPQTSR